MDQIIKWCLLRRTPKCAYYLMANFNVNMADTAYPNDLKFDLERDLIWNC